MKKILFIDRDGTLIKEAPPTYQIDSWEKIEFYPHVFKYLGRIVRELDYTLAMVTNQDGLGTSSFPEKNFWPIQNYILKCFENEGILFQSVHIDKSFPYEKKPTRKPGTAMLTEYLDHSLFDIQNSFVIGDRITDVQLAKNLGCRAFWLNNDPRLGKNEVVDEMGLLQSSIAMETTEWKRIYEYLKAGNRKTHLDRNTNETKISIDLNPDGSGKTEISTGLNFFDHMLDQLGRHSGMDLKITVKGDLHVDEHHTVEDTGIALGEALAKALGNKAGMERYGFVLPMDDCLAQVAIDFGGRSWLVWDVTFKREKIGDMPTEMFYHFFKSFSDAAKCNLNIKAEGDNEHHKIESIFKALAKAIKMAIKRDAENIQVPSTKGML
ncbi:MAG: bifunctional histidinol-phosphatase/imidazoleglycerol-phosphate dehydratase HisB [Bacteroidetes bacterium]|nr:bifunctional histidinol-phosphatase/imidazoleglycerol-phosphate dehydratase HisB [Bacteroidota bacterium]MBS1931895.1 bifunctional histidinol-phosphatase/imidazoleglycerol-phosphate dehydratase HisB [Bacteroidota bacterium]